MSTTATGLTDAQVIALEELFERDPDGASDVDEFLERTYTIPLLAPAFIDWCGMTVGVEPDGYTHT